MSMQAFAVNANNDFFIDATGQLVVAQDESAVLVACEQAVKAQLGEMVLASNIGIPTDQTVWSGNPDLIQFEFWLIQNIEAVPNVVRVTNIETSLNGSVLSYSATIETAFGEVFLNGGV